MLAIDDVPVIGRIGPRRDGVDTPFWEGLEAGEVRMQRCDKCQTWWWSPVWRCAECGSWDLHWEAIAPTGRIFSWVRTYQAFLPAMASVVPYVTALVELPQAGNRRLMGIIVGDEEGLEIGSPVEGVIQKASELTSGQAILRWKLKR